MTGREAGTRGHRAAAATLVAQCAVVVVSDTRTQATDESGALAVELITKAGHEIAHRSLLPNDDARVRTEVEALLARNDVDVIVLSGGTGLGKRDRTIEAVRPLLERELPGFGELFRWISYQKVGTSTIQSRATGGVVRGTYLFALPGSPGACRDGWEEVLKHQLDYRHRPCNLVELMPRLMER